MFASDFLTTVEIELLKSIQNAEIIQAAQQFSQQQIASAGAWILRQLTWLGKAVLKDPDLHEMLVDSVLSYLGPVGPALKYFVKKATTLLKGTLNTAANESSKRTLFDTAVNASYEYSKGVFKDALCRAALVNVVVCVIDIVWTTIQYKRGENYKNVGELYRHYLRSVSSAAGGTVAAAGGAWIGTWVGAFVGSIIPVVGTATGAAVGGFIGSVGCGIVGWYAGSYIYR